MLLGYINCTVTPVLFQDKHSEIKAVKLHHISFTMLRPMLSRGLNLVNLPTSKLQLILHLQ